MNRQQLKFLALSTALHGLLIVVLIAGMGLGSARRVTEDLTIIDVIPAHIIDEALVGGGDPRPPGRISDKPASPKPAEPQPPPSISPSTVRETKPQEAAPPIVKESKPAAAPPPVTRPEPEKTAPPEPKAAKETKPVESQKTEAVPPAVSKKETAPKRTVELKRTTRKTAIGKVSENKQAEEKEAAENARVAAINTWRGQVGRAVGTLRNNLSSATTVEVGGGGVGGTGGEAYAGYGIVVQSIYDHAWRDPEDVTDLTLHVRAKIVIARSGRVVSSEIVQRSSNAAMNKSVQQALDRVKEVPPFPAESKDIDRTFYINFYLQAKRLFG